MGNSEGTRGEIGVDDEGHCDGRLVTMLGASEGTRDVVIGGDVTNG